jgi:hypothetical protein
MIFARRIEHPLDVTVQGSHDPNAREHRRAAADLCGVDQIFDRSLPFLKLLFGLGHTFPPRLCQSLPPERQRIDSFELRARLEEAMKILAV